MFYIIIGRSSKYRKASFTDNEASFVNKDDFRLEHAIYGQPL